MVLHRLGAETPKKISLHWVGLFLVSGFVNAAGFLACASFVTHVTGFATSLGVSLAHQNWVEFLEALSVPILFLAGVFVAGCLVGKPKGYSDGLLYSRVMGLVGACLLIVAVGGHTRLFSHFGGVFSLQEVYLSLGLLAFASGLQNGVITIFSQGSVRVTHLTGLITDLGLGIFRAYFSNDPSEMTQKEKEGVQLRIIFFAAFIAGAFMGTVIYLRSGYLAFFVPSVIAFALTAMAKKEVGRNQAEIWRIETGRVQALGR